MDERIKALGELNDKITRIGAVLCDLDLGEEVEIEGVKYLHEKNEIDRSIIKATTPSGRTLRGLCSTDPLEPYHIHNLAPQCLGQSVSMVGEVYHDLGRREAFSPKGRYLEGRANHLS